MGSRPRHGYARPWLCNEGVTAEPDPPLSVAKDYRAPSLFQPVNLLREARRQRALPDIPVPLVCLLDPDGDIVRYLVASGEGKKHPGWACYHTEMWTVDLEGVTIGVVGTAVGAPFAVLVAEQLAVSGASTVLSITSAGRISADLATPCFVLIDRALRDEGTSSHYQPPARWSHLDRDLKSRLANAFADLTEPVSIRSSWTTDAPYRETSAAIAQAEALGVACVEMEAAGLYAYAAARGASVVCFAHITNTMATTGDDFEKGEDAGVYDALALTRAAALALTR